MADSNDILRSYLISLGYHVDLHSFRNFDQHLTGVQKKLVRVGLGVTGIVTATAAATSAFAYNMRRMYFESERSGATIQNLKGVGFAAKQVGIDSENLVGTLKDIYTSIQVDPGKKALLDSIIGEDSSKLDSLNTMTKLIEKLAMMPAWVGPRFAEQFGINAQDFLQLKRHLPEFKRSLEEIKALYKSMNVDYDESKSAVLELTHDLDFLGGQFDILGDKILLNFVGPLKDAINYMKGTQQAASEFLDNPKDNFSSWYEGTRMSSLIDAITGRGSLANSDLGYIVNRKGTARSGAKSVTVNTAEDIMNFFISRGYASDEAAAITANLHHESGFNIRAQGDKRGDQYTAHGIAQWRGKRLEDFKKRYGYSVQNSSLQDQLDFVDWELRNTESTSMKKLKGATGERLKAFEFAKAYERPNNNYAHYQDRMGLASKYLKEHKASSAVINQTTTINVTGSSNPEEVARIVASKQAQVNNSALRNLKGRHN